MTKDMYEELLNIALSTGADFAEIYYEDSVNKAYNVLNSKLDDINISKKRGLGIRISKGNDIYYSFSNQFDFETLKKIALDLSMNFQGDMDKKVVLEDLIEVFPEIEIPHDKFNIYDKKKILLDMDEKVRNFSSLVSQVSLSFREYDKNFIIANSEGKFISSRECNTRYLANVYVANGANSDNCFQSFGKGKGYEFLEDFDIEKLTIDTAKEAMDKLDAKFFEGGEVPAILEHGFGAVIFHEACGHALEATSVKTGISTFSDCYGKKIASDKVTLIDDSSIQGEWGSFMVDSEGNLSQKNILIKDGILNSYLVDHLSEYKMNHPANACGRRESYKYAPTSRMSNTYLASGTDKIDDMIKSIDYGIYCKSFLGGMVKPYTGDFNFTVSTAYLIEKGKITDCLKGITLIGNNKDILNNVEMVSDDLELSSGYCGSQSGMILVTIGQPTIKVSKILVGGKE